VNLSIVVLRQAQRIVLLLMAVSLTLLETTTTQIHCQTLNEIHRQVRALPRNANERTSANLYGPKWLDKNSNLYKVFVAKGGGEHLLDWAGYTFEGFSNGKASSDRKVEYVYAKRDFFDPNGTMVRMEILVPHPRSRMLSDFSLIEPFSSRRSKPSRVTPLETFTVEMQAAELFQTPKRTCMITLELPQGSLLSLSTNNCENKDLLKKMLEQVDVSRILVKLVT